MDALKALQSLGLGPETTGPEGDKLLQQAQQVWAMLDDMADKDPQAYKRFIEKQAQEHKELTAPPQPHMSIKTQFQVNKENNWWGWGRGGERDYTEGIKSERGE